MKKNGKIEVLRFFFCITVLMLHINKDLWNFEKTIFEHFSFFRRANISVSFFFLVSGFLMAKSIDRQRKCDNDTSVNLADDTLHFLWRKIKALLPYHLVFCALMILLLVRLYPEKMPEMIIDRLPSLFFLQATAIGGSFSSFLGVEWYLSSMFLAMAVLYPLCKKYYVMFSHLIAPVGGVLLLGYLTYTTGHLASSEFYGTVLALADIALGTVCYEICKKLQGIEFTAGKRALLSLTEAFCYGVTFLYICSRVSAKYDSYVLFLLCIGIILSFSQKGLFGESRIFQNRFCAFLGSVSLPVYLVQNVTRVFVLNWMNQLSPKWQCVSITALTLGLGVLSWLVYTAIERRKH